MRFSYAYKLCHTIQNATYGHVNSKCSDRLSHLIIDKVPVVCYRGLIRYIIICANCRVIWAPFFGYSLKPIFAYSYMAKLESQKQKRSSGLYGMRIFTVLRMCTDSPGIFSSPWAHVQSTVTSDLLSGQWRSWSDCVNAQSDQGLRCSYMPQSSLFSWRGLYGRSILHMQLRKFLHNLNWVQIYWEDTKQRLLK